jgi:two-component system NtrC family sensor kinase
MYPDMTPPRPTSPDHPRIDVGAISHAFPQFIDALTDAVVMIDRNRRVVAANRRYIEAFGARSERLVGTICHENLNCPELRGGETGERCAACRVVDEGRPERLLRSIPDADGALRRWEAVLSPVLDDTGQVDYIVEVWRDITDRSRLEGQLAHSERLASLGILAAGVAHEINNPMASIMAAVDSLNRWLGRSESLDASDRAEASDILGMLESATLRCGETTDKLLLLAQPNQKAPAWVDLNRVVEDTVSLLGYLMRRNGVEAELLLADDLPNVWGRDSGLRGVVMNLCLNAVQAMGNGGRLAIRTAAVPDGIALVVDDSGPGIPPPLLDRIWDPFFTTKPPGEGTGLGLSITHQVVTRHGGTIEVRSRPGDGTQFTVRLPLGGPGGDGV